VLESGRRRLGRGARSGTADRRVSCGVGGRGSASGAVARIEVEVGDRLGVGQIKGGRLVGVYVPVTQAVPTAASIAVRANTTAAEAAANVASLFRLAGITVMLAGLGFGAWLVLIMVRTRNAT